LNRFPPVTLGAGSLASAPLLGRPSNRRPLGLGGLIFIVLASWAGDLVTVSSAGDMRSVWRSTTAGEAAAHRLREVFLEPACARYSRRASVFRSSRVQAIAGVARLAPPLASAWVPCAAALNDGRARHRPAPQTSALHLARRGRGRIASTAAPPEARRLCTVGHPFSPTIPRSSGRSSDPPPANRRVDVGGRVPRRMPAGRTMETAGDRRRQETPQSIKVLLAARRYRHFPYSRLLPSPGRVLSSAAAAVQLRLPAAPPWARSGRMFRGREAARRCGAARKETTTATGEAIASGGRRSPPSAELVAASGGGRNQKLHYPSFRSSGSENARCAKRASTDPGAARVTPPRSGCGSARCGVAARYERRRENEDDCIVRSAARVAHQRSDEERARDLLTRLRSAVRDPSRRRRGQRRVDSPRRPGESLAAVSSRMSAAPRATRSQLHRADCLSDAV